MLIEPRLTGKRRFRLHKRFLRESLVVVQVQWEGTVMENDCGVIDSHIGTWWRDARPEDVMEKD